MSVRQRGAGLHEGKHPECGAQSCGMTRLPTPLQPGPRALTAGIRLLGSDSLLSEPDLGHGGRGPLRPVRSSLLIKSRRLSSAPSQEGEGDELAPVSAMAFP